MPDMPPAEQSHGPGRSDAGRRPSTSTAIEFPEVVDASGCTAIPNSVLDDHRMGPETRLVYVMLRRLAATNSGRAIGQSELARHVGIPAHRIPWHLALLRRSGVIRIQGESSARVPNHYWIMEPAMLSDRPPRAAAMAAQSQTRGTASSTARNLLQRLIVIGVDPRVAGRLVATYPTERVAGALRAAHRRRTRPRDPAAWIVAAIRQGWVAQEAEIAARQRQEARERAIVTWERRADATLSALPAETQESLRQRAAEVVNKRFGERLAATTIGAMLVTAEVRRLVAEQAGIPPPDAMTLTG